MMLLLGRVVVALWVSARQACTGALRRGGAPGRATTTCADTRLGQEGGQPFRGSQSLCFT